MRNTPVLWSQPMSQFTEAGLYVQLEPRCLAKCKPYSSKSNRATILQQTCPSGQKKDVRHYCQRPLTCGMRGLLERAQV